MTDKEFVLAIYPEACVCPDRYNWKTYYYVFNLGFMDSRTILHNTEEEAWCGARKITNGRILDKLAS